MNEYQSASLEERILLDIEKERDPDTYRRQAFKELAESMGAGNRKERRAFISRLKASLRKESRQKLRASE